MGEKFATGVADTGGKFATDVVDTGGAPWPRIFEKIRNGLNGILWVWGETDSWKKPEAKNLVTLSLLKKIYRLSLISAGSISLDSTFKTDI